jgi:2-polyprenyl-3-methyl-5-hydroxy-6-metoxy-1,4-benzoquinol methylase
MTGIGGYDDGYRKCSCFWGSEPGSLVRHFAEVTSDIQGMKVLDVGCGEGKNAAFLAERGAAVTALDVSPHALANARQTWPNTPRIQWILSDVAASDLPDGPYDLVIAYGLLHCLSDQRTVEDTVRAIQRNTVPGGWNILCAFNSRHQELAEAHPGFAPCLLPHAVYLGAYSAWRLVLASDKDLYETHPHNGVPHTHSMTRLLAQKPRAAE